ncbi:MAG: hypothetical protein AAFY08_11500 [Planctomycetota bacterium]
MAIQFKLSPELLERLRSYTFDENAERRGAIVPSHFIYWTDELPNLRDFILEKGDRNTISALLAARRHYWFNETIPECFEEVWEAAKAEMPSWPGFQRLYVDEDTRQHAIECEKGGEEFWLGIAEDADSVSIEDRGDGFHSISITMSVDGKPSTQRLTWRARLFAALRRVWPFC